MNTPEPLPDGPPKHKPREVGDLVWLVPTSAMLHAIVTVALALGVVLKFHGCYIGPVGGNEMGENGIAGAGSRTTEISVEGPVTGAIGPAAPAPPDTPSAGSSQPAEQPSPASPPPEPQRPDPTRPPRAPTRAARVLVAPRSEHTATNDDSASSASAAPDRNAHATASGTAPARPVPGGGTGAASSSGGRAPGSIGAQRALLPRAVVCNDPVAGTWRTHKYDPLYGDWMFAALRIHRNADNSLSGVITAHQWNGSVFNSRPPPCDGDPGRYEIIVDEPAHGTLRGNHVDFGANDYRVRRLVCNTLGSLAMYNPDHFSGTIDPDLQEFQSVNNDGGHDVNAPYVFRRIACEAGDEAHPESAPADSDPVPSAPAPAPAVAPPHPTAPAAPAPSPPRPAALPPRSPPSSAPPPDWAPPQH